MQKTNLPEGLTERLFHTIWQFQYFNLTDLTTEKGEPISILHQGKYNVNSGPDFLDARIRIGKTILAGRIELHLKSSDWVMHGHEKDSNYQNLILHVVFVDDLPGLLPNVPVLELGDRIPSYLLQTANRLLNSNQFPPCRNNLSAEVLQVFPMFSEKLLVERLIRRSEEIRNTFVKYEKNWNLVSWVLLCKAFGGPVNGEAFESLALSFPFKLLQKLQGKLISIEALLFGQARLLDKEYSDPYYQLLQREYLYLKKLYGLRESSLPVHFLRMRPHNFPTIKIALLAAYCSSNEIFIDDCIEEETGLRKKVLGVTANDYWHYHFRFGEESSYNPKSITRPLFESLMINWKIPLMFTYGKWVHDEAIIKRALDELQALKPEDNSIIKKYADAGFIISGAGSTQAILELKAHYCDRKRCLECNLGNKILKRDSYSTERHFL